MYRIVYMSRTAKELSDQELDTILREADVSTAQGALSGMMLYARSSFFHVMEGPQRRVEDGFERVFMDMRHERIRVFQHRPIRCRRFKGFTMGFHRTSAVPPPRGFFELSQSALWDRIPAEAAEDLRKLLKGYGEVKVEPAMVPECQPSV